MGSRGRLVFVLSLAACARGQDFTTGDECLFCHRVKPADTWQQNPHARTIRPLVDEADKHGFPPDTEQVLGARAHFRGLKQNGYGRFSLLSTDLKSWDPDKFAKQCSGCHATAVNPSTGAFATASLDCYTCHGIANMDHPKDVSLMWLSSKHERDPKLIDSICGQCHLRGGKSKSTGRPYPNHFAAGDNLFADFQLDWTNPSDRHVYINVREVLENGGTVTCLSCHQVHGDSTQKHRRVLTGPICVECHNAAGPKKAVKPYMDRSAVCEY